MFTISAANETDFVDIQRIYLDLKRPARQQFQVEEYFVARDGEHLIGCAAVHLIRSPGAGEGYLYGLGVKKEFQRRGIGRGLTEARVARVRSSGGARAAALAMFWNVSFFRRLGFATVPRDSLSPAMRNLADFGDNRYRRSAVLLREIES